MKQPIMVKKYTRQDICFLKKVIKITRSIKSHYFQIPATNQKHH